MDDALRITSTGLTLTATSVVLSGVAIPVDANGAGNFARNLRVMCESGFAYVKVGTSVQSTTLAATLQDILVTANESVILHTRGLTHISVITRSGTTILNAVPIET